MKFYDSGNTHTHLQCTYVETYILRYLSHFPNLTGLCLYPWQMHLLRLILR